MPAAEFTVGETCFALEPLKVKAQLRAVALLAPILTDLIAAKSGAGAFASLDRLPDLVDLFAERCKVTLSDGKIMPLKAFQDNVFERAPSLLFAWLAECVKIELGDFLAEHGQSLLKATVEGFTSPRA